MPELPEVEIAARIARQALVGRVLENVTPHHPSQRRLFPPRDQRRVAGRTVAAVERRAKHQHIVLDDGAIIAVHFRMNGDWDVSLSAEPLPRFARVAFTTADGTRLSLVDSRALCAVSYHPPGHAPELALGPEPDALSVALLRDALAGKAGPIKPTLLDQRVVAGLGNIYAAESLWRAGIHPARAARSLDARELRALVRGIKGAIADGFRRAGRYRVGHRDRPFNVYDREGRSCNRCHGTVQRIPQAGRSTYFCPACQPRATPRGARAAAP